MSEDRAGKTFDAPPARRQRAVREGNVARSIEITSIVALAGASVATFAVAPFIGGAAAHVLDRLARGPETASVPPELALAVAAAFVPATAAAGCAAIAALAQGGGLRLRMPSFKLTVLNPIAGLKRMVGAEAVAGAFRAAIAFSVVCAALLPLGRDIVAGSIGLSGTGAIAAFAGATMQRALWTAMVVGAAFALVDYVLVRRRWLQGLKMSLAEIKRDHKENDGDPQARSRRATLHRTMMRGSIARTKEASFVVVNPTHIAIAIRYAPPEVPVPEILVRAADDAALTVKRIATSLAIPIVEDIPLARALFADGDAGRPIPTTLYVAIAQVIAELARAGVLA